MSLVREYKMRIYSLLKYTLGLMLFLIVGLYSCKSKQQILQAESDLEYKTSSDLFEDILQRDLSYSTFSSKLNMTITTGKRALSSKGNLRIVRNEAIQLSVQPLFGIEMFRLHVEPRFIVVLDRMNKRYVQESFDDIKEFIPVGFDYYTLQSLFTNSLFIPEQSVVNTKDYRKFKYFQQEDNYLLSAHDKRTLVDYSFFVNGNDQITLTELSLAKEKYSLEWSYDQFSLLKDLFFPHEMKIAASTGKRKFDTSISLSSVSLNNSFTLSNSIPSGYKKVELSEVLEILASK